MPTWPQRMIAMNHINMGQRDSDLGAFREAIDHFRVARDLMQKSIDQFGTDPSRQALLGPSSCTHESLSPEPALR